MRLSSSTLLMTLFAGLAAVPGAAQTPSPPPPRASFVAATQSASDAAALTRVRETMARMEAAGQLRLASRFGDRVLPGRVHESFRQYHRGVVPVQGGGLSIQRDGEAVVSALGTLHRGIDVGTRPRLSPADAVARATELAGVGPATDDPPTLVVLPTPVGGYALAWRLVMRDMNLWFIDAGSGEAVYRESLVRAREGVAVGSGLGAHGQRQKLSVTEVVRGITRDGFEARDQLRGAEIVTLDLAQDQERLNALLQPDVSWDSGDVAYDQDNDWEKESVVSAHAHLGLVHDYLFQKQQWNGLDGEGGRVLAATNLAFANAFWVRPPFGFEGTGALAFGTVGGSFGDSPSIATLDIVGHEFMHGVTYFAVHGRTGDAFGGSHIGVPGPSTIALEDGAVLKCGDSWSFPGREGPFGEVEEGQEAPLFCDDGRFVLFWHEAGAIDEAMSDILGAEAEFAWHPPGDGPLRADWLLGEDLGVGLVRNIGDPGALKIGGDLVYPDSMARGFRFAVALVGERLIRYTPLLFRGGELVGRLGGAGGYDGVHWNSTIVSHSFVLAVDGGTHRSSGTSVTGVGAANRDRVARVYFRAMTEMMPARGTFEMFAAAVRQSAVDLHGASSAEYAAVHQALTAVGLRSDEAAR